MAYYLSYIEIKGHAALMLAEQPDLNGPAKIIFEAGFGDAPGGVGAKYLLWTPGEVSEEANASKALI